MIQLMQIKTFGKQDVKKFAHIAVRSYNDAAQYE
jgi:hypothetical protein